MPSSAPSSGMVLFPPALHSLPLPFESHPSKKYRHPDGCLYFLADRVGFEPTSPLLDYLISSLFCNCDGGARFGVVSVSPVPAESRLKSGFFARKALRDRLF